MAEDKKLTQLIINELTKAQYEALGDNVNEDEIYVITDDEVEIKSDGATIVGNGTTATPLAISPEFIEKVNTEISDRETAIESLQEQITANSEAITELDNTKVEKSSLGVASGVATLDANAKVPLSQINDSLIGNVNYQGLYDASTNMPNLDTVAPKGHYYITSVRGTAQGVSLEVGDWIISNGASWDKVDNTDAVSSVNGRTGNVVITKEDIDLSEYVKFTDYAGVDGTPGTIKTSAAYGTQMVDAGYIRAGADNLESYQTRSVNFFVGKGTLENIKNDLVKRAVTENDITLTDDEKTAARTWIGAGSQTELDTKASKTELEAAVETLTESIDAVETDLGTNYVKKSGDTMTGTLTVQSNLTSVVDYADSIVLTAGLNDAEPTSSAKLSVNTSGSLEVTAKDCRFVFTQAGGFYRDGTSGYLGAPMRPWETIYAKTLDNGKKLNIPTLGGILARIEDIPHVETLPEATAENINKILQYVGETTDTATQGYFYKNVGTESVEWSGMLMLSTSTEADATIIVDSSKLLAQDPLYSGNGSCVLLYRDGEWVNWDETTFDTAKTVSSLDDWGVAVTMNDGSTYTPQSGDYVRVISTAVTTYAWEQITVQESFPDQTNNAGKFLTTDGEKVSWGEALTNKSTHANATAIGYNKQISTWKGDIYIGTPSSYQTTGKSVGGVVVIGENADTLNSGCFNSIAIGANARVGGQKAIQLGWGANSDANTFKVGNANGNFELMSADGTIPTERLAPDGTAGQVLTKTEDGMSWVDVPTDVVTSVNNKTGDVTLTAEDINTTVDENTVTVKEAIATLSEAKDDLVARTTAIESKIPTQASSTNILVDRAYLEAAIADLSSVTIRNWK